jgi:hypothetical protein
MQMLFIYSVLDFIPIYKMFDIPLWSTGIQRTYTLVEVKLQLRR